MTYSKLAKEMLEPFGGTKKHNLNSILKIRDKTCDTGDSFLPADYHDIDAFIRHLKNKKGTKFTTLSLNIESISSKFNKLTAFLETLSRENCFLDAILIQESWLSENDCKKDGTVFKNFSIPGYQTIPLGRKCGRKGGLIIYLRANYSYTPRDLYKTSTDWEGQFIDVTHINKEKLSSKITLANIYRPPRDNYSDASIDKFLKPMTDIILKLIKENSTIITGGDFNIDLLLLTSKEKFQEYFDIFVSNGLLPQITLPTRFSKRRATLIDQIFCRFSKITSELKSGIVVTKISDHLPCFSTIKVKFKATSKPPEFVKVDKNGPKDIEDFRKEVQKCINLTDFDNDLLADPNDNYEKLETIIKLAKEKCLPLTEVKFKKYKHKISPWITFAIINSIKSRDQLYVKWKKENPDSQKYAELENLFHSHCSILQKSIRAAKKIYYHQQFENFKSNIKKTWSKINEILSRKKKDSGLPSYFCDGNNILTSNEDIANCFNRFFCNIGPELANSIKGPEGKSYQDYLKQNILSSFSFSTVSSDDVKDMIASLKSKSSFGHDGVSSILLKQLSPEIYKVLTCIINQSLMTGIFPNSLKIAKISPIYKKEDPHLTDNYRPISLLPVISKVFEKVAFKQVYNYFDKNKLLYKSQYGFRKKHSTELAGLEFNDKIVNYLDKGQLPLAIFLDLSKAFDTIDHDILIRKLYYYGVAGNSLNWFKSYLTNRKQYVQFKDSVSSCSMIKTGVPQGSILGPLLFIIYMNDIAHITDKFYFTIYADDTTLIAPICTFSVSDKNDYDTISQNINSEINVITDWLALNKLSLNAKKTKMMVFHYHQKRISNMKLKLFINRTKIEQVKEFCFLGVVFDECLTWKSHVQKIGGKISMANGTLNRLKKFLPQEVLKIIYNSLILPHLNFGILLWGHNSKRIFRLQKWAVRAVTSSKYNAHTNPIFQKLKLIKLDDIKNLAYLKFHYKYTKNDLPKYFDNMFDQKYLTHNYSTRNRNEPLPADWKKQAAKRSIRFSLLPAIKSLPNELKSDYKNIKLHALAKKAKKIFVDSYSDRCNDSSCFVCKSNPKKS